MSTVKANTYQDASGGNTATINSMTPTADSLQGFRNRIINGDMRIDQRNAGAAVTVNSTTDFYPVDRFSGYGEVSDGVYTLQQSSTAPSGFVNSIIATVTTADASVGASQYYFLQQKIEGTNVSDLAFGTASAKTVTLSFWVRSSLTGQFGGALSNSGVNRSYPFTYTINSANTWEYKTITVAGDTSGTWLTTTGIGMRVYWDLGSGSNNIGTAGVWGSAGYVGATGDTKLISTLNATWYITGVQLEVGSTATPFERRPYGTELNLCYRYYYRISPSATFKILGLGWNFNTTTAQITGTFPVPLRTAPSALEQSGTASHYRVDHTSTATNCSVVPSFDTGSTNYMYLVSFIVSSGLTAGQGCAGVTNNTAAYLGWSAEL